MDFADGSMLDTTGGTCSMAGGSMASNWCKKKQTDRNHKPCTNIHRKIRVRQWKTWLRREDRWIGAAEVVRDLLKQ